MRFILSAVFFMVGCHVATATEIPNSQFGWGNWRGGAYTHDETGVFSHCGVSTSYLNDHSLYFFVYENAAFTLGFATPKPAFKIGQILPVRVVVDRNGSFDGEASVVQDRFSVLRIYEDKKALEAIKRGQRLRVFLGGKVTSFDLSGTFRAIEATKRCAAYYRGFVSRPVAKAPVPDAPKSLVDQSVLYQIATHQIARMGVQDSRYLTREEVQNLVAHEGIFWFSETANLYGGVYVRPADGIRNLQESDSRDLLEITRGCSGDIVSGSRNVATDDLQTREMRARCTLETHLTEVIVQKVLVEDIIVYTALMFSDPLGSKIPAEREEERREVSEDVAARAAVYVINSRR